MIGLLLALAAPAQAADISLSYSARLINGSGAAIEGPHTVRVSLYEDDSTLTPLWTQQYATTLDGGYFSTTLDTGDGVNTTIDSAWFSSNVWVGLSVDGGDELNPRQQLVDVPSAAMSDVSQRVRTEGAAVGSACEVGELVFDTSLHALRVCIDVGGGNTDWSPIYQNREIQLDPAGHRRWSDGSYAASCAEYRTPGTGFIYDGDTGSGTYRVDSDGVGTGRDAYDVYCDMSHNGGGWTLIANIYDDDANNWDAFNPNWTSGEPFGTSYSTSNLKEDAKTPAFDTVSGDEILIYYKGLPFLQSATGCFSNDMESYLASLAWNSGNSYACSVPYHNTTLGEKAMSCTSGTSSCGSISSLYVHWGESATQEPTNNDQVMFSTNRRAGVSSVGGIGSRRGYNGFTCPTCNEQDVSEDNDSSLNLPGEHWYTLLVR